MTWTRGALALALVLASCGGPTTEARRVEHAERVVPAEIAVPRPMVEPIALTLGQLRLQSMDVRPASSRETTPPLIAEMVDDAGHVTGTRCGATWLMQDGTLRRDDEIVARLSPTPNGWVLYDGASRETHLVIREHRIETESGELRFRRDGDHIVSVDAEAPSIAITPPSANLETALALFATLLVCDDVGP